MDGRTFLRSGIIKFMMRNEKRCAKIRGHLPELLGRLDICSLNNVTGLGSKAQSLSIPIYAYLLLNAIDLLLYFRHCLIIAKKSHINFLTSHFLKVDIKLISVR